MENNNSKFLTLDKVPSILHPIANKLTALYNSVTALYRGCENFANQLVELGESVATLFRVCENFSNLSSELTSGCFWDNYPEAMPKIPAATPTYEPKGFNIWDYIKDNCRGVIGADYVPQDDAPGGMEDLFGSWLWNVSSGDLPEILKRLKHHGGLLRKAQYSEGEETYDYELSVDMPTILSAESRTENGDTAFMLQGFSGINNQSTFLGDEWQNFVGEVIIMQPSEISEEYATIGVNIFYVDMDSNTMQISEDSEKPVNNKLTLRETIERKIAGIKERANQNNSNTQSDGNTD